MAQKGHKYCKLTDEDVFVCVGTTLYIVEPPQWRSKELKEFEATISNIGQTYIYFNKGKYDERCFDIKEGKCKYNNNYTFDVFTSKQAYESYLKRKEQIEFLITGIKKLRNNANYSANLVIDNFYNEISSLIKESNLNNKGKGAT